MQACLRLKWIIKKYNFFQCIKNSSQPRPDKELWDGNWRLFGPLFEVGGCILAASISVFPAAFKGLCSLAFSLLYILLSSFPILCSAISQTFFTLTSSSPFFFPNRDCANLKRLKGTYWSDRLSFFTAFKEKGEKNSRLKSCIELHSPESGENRLEDESLTGKMFCTKVYIEVVAGKVIASSKKRIFCVNARKREGLIPINNWQNLLKLHSFHLKIYN